MITPEQRNDSRTTHDSNIVWLQASQAPLPRHIMITNTEFSDPTSLSFALNANLAFYDNANRKLLFDDTRSSFRTYRVAESAGGSAVKNLCTLFGSDQNKYDDLVKLGERGLSIPTISLVDVFPSGGHFATMPRAFESSRELRQVVGGVILPFMSYLGWNNDLPVSVKTNIVNF